MKRLVVFTVLIAVVAILVLRDDRTPTGEEVVAMPRAELYAALADRYARIEAKAATIRTVAGKPPRPVKFTFAKKDGEMLGLTAVTGLREVEVNTWLEDGDRPGETKLRVLFEPASLYEKSGDKTLRRALETTLERVDLQFVEGQRITALFGGTTVRRR